ncbi:MAG: hypothetical protein A2Y24_01980 [Clostridiales bacterium GWE2_32_10]|nr:MAG: hypothetical protein A2Y24_01980 [Clostridiales bacterium GWE2_32_10]
MNVNYTMFYNCIANNGGAIWYNSLNSFLRKICANRCSCGAKNYAHFAILYASQENQMEYLSVSYCSHTTFGKYTIYIESGNQRVYNTNSSMNKALELSGIGIHHMTVQELNLVFVEELVKMMMEE